METRARGDGEKNEGACSMTTGLTSTEAGCFRLLQDPGAGRHACGAHIHVHIEDSKSLPFLAHPQAWQGWECALCNLMWAEVKKLLPSVSLRWGWGKGLKIKANLMTPMTTTATTGCTTTEHEQEHIDTGAEWRGHWAQGHADS